MAELDQLIRALKAADAAGDTAAASKLAAAIRAQQQLPAAEPQAPSLPAPPIPQQSPAPNGGRGGAFLRGAAQGLTLNFADELGAGARMAEERDLPLAQQSQVNPFEEQLQRSRANLRAGEQAYPLTSLAGNVAGGVGLGAGLGSAGATLMKGATSIPGAVGRGMVEGAAYGGASGLGGGEGTEGRLRGAATGAGMGAAVGGVMGGVGRAIGGSRAEPAPSIADLRTQSGAAYKAAEGAGVTVSRNSLSSFAKDLEQAVGKQGFDSQLHPEIAASLNRLTKDSAGDLSLDKLEVLRRVFKGAAASPNDHTSSLAQTMIGKLDDYIEKLSPADLTSGDPGQAGQILKTARSLWSRSAKGEEVAQLMENARIRAPNFSASGYENALRGEFRKLATNQQRLRLFNAAEQEAIKKVATGGPLVNTLRQIGKLAPTGAVSGGAGVGLGYLAGGPVGAVALPALGGAARLGATGLTIRNVKLASELMRRGGPAIAQSGVLPGTSALISGGAAGMTAEQKRRKALAEALTAESSP